MFHLVGYAVVVVPGCVCVVFLAIGKRAETFESLLFYEVDEALECGIVFAREADHHRCAYVYARHLAAYAFEQPPCLLGGDVSSHVVEYGVVDMLQGYVEVLAYFLAPGHDGQYAVGEIRRVGVVEANHFYTLYVGHVVYEFGQGVVGCSVEVAAIRRQVLGDYIELACAL